MKYSVKTIGTAALIFAVLMLIIFGSGFLLQAGRAQSPNRSRFASDVSVRTITVSGLGHARAQPDIATIFFKVEIVTENAQAAITQNDEQVQSLIDVLKSADIQPEDIQTQTVQLQPLYTGQPQKTRAFLGHAATNIVEVIVRDINNVGLLLDTTVQLEYIFIEKILYGVEDPSQKLDQARAEALEDARAKAERLASQMNAQLDEVLAIEEESRLPSSITRDAAGDEESAIRLIEPGMQEIEVDVEVTWILSEGQESIDPDGEVRQPAATDSPLE